MTIANNLLQQRLKKMRPEQIRKLMAKKKPSSGQKMVKMERNSLQEYPLSKAQERIWFLAKLYPKTSLYNIPIAISIQSGDIDPLRLRRVINLIIQNNEIFRTSFHEREGKVYQKVHPDLQLTVEYEDISHINADAEKKELVEQIGRSHGNTIFVLEKLPLLGVKLVKKAENDFVLLFNLHHLISDGWTNSLLARDSAIYYANDTDPLQEKERVQYVDYVRWEQEWLQSSRHKSQLGFWKKELSGFPEPLRFPRDFQAQQHSFAGRTAHCSISSAVHEKVSIYCQKNGLTPYQFYISCYALLIARYTGVRDMVIGTPVANRNQSLFLNTYGVFINSLPLRFTIDPGLDFEQLVQGCKEKIVQCMDNQEIPFSEIINAINPQRKLHENPLYNIHFAYQHFPQKDKKDEHSLLPIDYCTAKFDLNFWIEIAGNTRTISVSYKDNLFSRQKIHRFMQHFLLLVEAVIAQPKVAFTQLDYIPPEHLSFLMAKKEEYAEISWIELFEQSVQRFSGEIALVDSQGKMSYQQLNLQAMALAQALILKGVKKDDIVILQTERNRNHIIAILACMKCGATYLPTDKRIPPARFEHMCKESQAKIVVSEADIAGVNCLGFASIYSTSSLHGSFETVRVQPEDLAYVVYTSGSSGTPKGVCVPHRALTNYSRAMKKVVDVSDTLSSFAHVSALDADLGNTAIFLTLGFGKTLLLPPADALVDPALLASFFMENPADAIKIVPAHLHALKEQLSAILPKKLLLFAGDSLDSHLLGAVRSVAPQLRIMNHYAPAEATISSLSYDVPLPFDGETVPIGRPIANTGVFVLDKEGNVIPQGSRGEICLTGVNIANGYLQKPELTGAKFVEDMSLSPEKIYHTGDLGCLNGEGQILFLGRMDRQIKRNGFRVELEEIEVILRKHPAVANCAVFLSSQGSGADRLLAAVELCDVVETRQLNSYLARYFIRALLPVIVVVEKIPLSANGKIDRDSLRAPSLRSDKGQKNIPSDLVELQLTTLFKAVLKISELSVDEQFFDLGGHSLLAISLISQVNKIFNTQFPIAILFQYGSVREMAAYIRKEEKDAQENHSPLVTLMDRQVKGVKQDGTKNMVWAHPAGGNVMSYYPIARSMQTICTTRAFIPIDHHRKEQLSITIMAEEYADILQGRPYKTEVILAGWSMGALIAHQMAVHLAGFVNNPPLILVDQPVPHPGARPLGSYEEKLIRYIERIEVFTGEVIKLSSTTEQKLELKVLHGEFIRLGLMPADVTMESFKIFLDVLVLHNEIVAGFTPLIYRGPTLLLKASEKLMLETNNPQPEYRLEDLGWGDFCPNLTIMELPGNHITMMTKKYAATVAEVIQSWLESLRE